MKKDRMVIVLVGAMVCFTFLWQLRAFMSSQDSFSQLRIGNTIISTIEVARTSSEQEKGLSGKESIPVDYGMLFPFTKPGYYQFWMKDMNFSIDMIWLDKEGKVVGLKENATPASYPQTFVSQHPASYVLETFPGLISKENLKIGDSVVFQK